MKVSDTKKAMSMLAVIALFAALASCGCAHFFDRIDAELERLDRAALVDRFRDIETPAKPSPKNPADEIDLSTVAWHGPDIRGWPIASEMPQGAYVSGSMLHFPHTRSGQWAANEAGLEGNPWVIVRVGGQWRAATFEWLRKGQTSKPWAKVRADHIKVSAFGDYQLQRGEEFYVIVSGRARGAEVGTQERTAARKVVWR